MAGPDFYKILGVMRTASADEIKLAHRELVKKYHPDLFVSSTQKARANQKLQEINEAYATLSNAERRRQYDSRSFQRETVVKPAGPSGNPSSTATYRRRPRTAPVWDRLARRANEKLLQINKTLGVLAKTARDSYRDLGQKTRTARKAAATQSTSALKKSGLSAARAWRFVRPWTHWVSVKVTVGILLTMVLILAVQAGWKEPEIAIAWTLLENTVVEPPSNNSGAQDWNALGYHSSRAQCSGSLKQRVALDEQAGGKVFLDQRTGTIAMTVYVKTESMLTEEYLQEKLKQGRDAGIDPEVLKQQARDEAREFVKKNGLTQRVTHYLCRETQIVKPDSWLRSKLKQIGIIS